MPKRVKLLVAMYLAAATCACAMGVSDPLRFGDEAFSAAYAICVTSASLGVWAAIGVSTWRFRLGVFAALTLFTTSVATIVAIIDDVGDSPGRAAMIVVPLAVVPSLVTYLTSGVLNWRGVRCVRTTREDVSREARVRFSLRAILGLTLLVATTCAVAPYLNFLEPDDSLQLVTFVLSVAVVACPIGILPLVSAWTMLTFGQPIKRFPVGLVVTVAVAVQSCYFMDSVDLDGTIIGVLSSLTVYLVQCASLWVVRSTGYRLDWAPVPEQAPSEEPGAMTILEPAIA